MSETGQPLQLAATVLGLLACSCTHPLSIRAERIGIANTLFKLIHKPGQETTSGCPQEHVTAPQPQMPYTAQHDKILSTSLYEHFATSAKGAG